MNKMQKVIIIAVILSGLLMITGCATKGRISVLDLDLRTPEQTLAYQNEADIVYTPDCCLSNPCENTATIKAAPSFPWDIIIRIVEVFKGRIKILSVEWKK